MWSDVSSLTFTERYYSGTINILFAYWYHGSDISDDAFDGKGGVVAHAFYPSSTTLGGDIHFDDSENWTAYSYLGK